MSRRLCQPEPNRLAVCSGIALGLAACAVTLSIMACTGTGRETVDGGRWDAGVTVSDANSFADASGSDGSVPDPGRESDCFDFLDDDGDLSIDCADPGCGDAPVCCALGVAGNERDACCTPGLVRTLDLGPCSLGSDARGCAGGTSFGSAPLQVMEGLSLCGGSERSLVPGPSEGADTGIVLPGLLEPAGSRIEVDFTMGLARDGLAGRLGRMGIGLVEGAPGARVLPVLAIVASNGELRVVVGGDETRVDVADLECLTAVPLHLSIDPSGSFSLWSGGRLVHTGTVTLPRRALLAVYGRHDAGAPLAWIGGVSVHSDVCSRLSPERSSASVVEGVTAGARIGRVAIARRLPGEPGRVAIEIDGRILPATEVEGGVRVDDTVNPLVPAGEAVHGLADWALGAGDPQLLAVSGGYLLVFTGHDADGSTAIFAQSFSDTLGSPTPALPVLTLGAAQSFDGSILSVDHPSYFEFGGAPYLLFRATSMTNTSLRLVALSAPLSTALADGTVPAAAVRDAAFAETGLGAVLAASGSDAFDRDEVGGARPIDLGDHVLRIFYSGRRGTRWSIGALVTVDLFHYEHVLGGAPILGPSGVGFDALGVLDPEPVASADLLGAANLTLYYTGTTGTAWTLGAATQSIHIGEAP